MGGDQVVGKRDRVPVDALQPHQIGGEVLLSNGRNKHTEAETAGGVMQRFMYSLTVTPTSRPHRVLYKTGRECGMNEN